MLNQVNAKPADDETALVPLTGGVGLGLTRPEQHVFERVHAAIVGHALPPGTKLAEEELAGIYGLSRMRIRRVLLSLSHARVVTLFAGRGAFVASPLPAEARAVFQSRRLIETAVLLEAGDRGGDELFARLRDLVSMGREAGARGDRQEAIRLSGAFHVELVAELGNAVIAEIVRELVARSSLVITLYQVSGRPVCRDDHHAQLVELLARGELRRAASAMRAHLTEIEAGLDLSERRTDSVDLRAALAR